MSKKEEQTMSLHEKLSRIQVEFWEKDLKAYLLGSNDYVYMELLIDKAAEIHFFIEKIKQEINNK
jgi:hypothetical protein